MEVGFRNPLSCSRLSEVSYVRREGTMRALLIAFVFLAGQSSAEPIKNDIQWDDGDSGTIKGVKFRLADVDG